MQIFTCPVNAMPGLKVLGVVERNSTFVVSLTIPVSVCVAFWETPVASSFTVALMATFALL